MIFFLSGPGSGPGLSFVLVGPVCTNLKLLIFEAFIDMNEQQEMIVYRFFSSSNQLKVVITLVLYMFMYTEGARYWLKKTGLDPAGPGPEPDRVRV